MHDNDNSNLPILDDIITPGDADKAVQRPPRKMQGTLWDSEPADPATAESLTEEELATDMEQHADHAETFAEEQPAINTAEPAETNLSIDPDNVTPADQTASAEPSADSVDALQTAFSSDDIASLTEEIMACMTPEIERILREKIRQILENRLSAGTDSDPE
jgi:hypothetical protein